MEIKATLSETLDETPEDTKDIKKAIDYFNDQFKDKEEKALIIKITDEINAKLSTLPVGELQLVSTMKGGGSNYHSFILKTALGENELSSFYGSDDRAWDIFSQIKK